MLGTPPSSITAPEDVTHNINNVYGKATTTGLRRVIAAAMDREFVELPFDSFMKGYLPFVPSNEVMDKVTRYLLSETRQTSSENGLSEKGFSDAPESLQNALKARKSLMLRHNNRLMFRAFQQPPNQTDGTEKDVYSPLSKISEKISNIPDLIPERQRNTFHYRDVPSKTIHSEISGSNNTIDACFMRGDSISQPSIHDVAVVIEQKLSSEQRGGNNRQAVSTNVQIMNDDVRRMFTFGMTIESDQVTVWFHSRSHSAICEQFSLVEQPELLLKVFTSFLFATKEELGYDPLIEYVGKGRYVFRGIQNAENPSQVDTYKTLETIPEIRANNITGPMARVFTVVKYLPESKCYGTKKYVLKDVWLDDTAQTERELQDAIFHDIDEFWSSDKTPSGLDSIKEQHRDLVTSQRYKKHFLTIVGDYVGQQSKVIAADYVPVRGLLHGPSLEDDIPVPEFIPVPRTITDKAQAKHTIPEGIENDKKAYRHFAREDFERSYSIKKQYRVVFSEVCRTVGQLDTLGEAINLLGDILTPLELMLCAGWVHRDLSSGNIMAYRENSENTRQPWRGILADLEYAKKFPPAAGYSPFLDRKIGTPFYMSIEIMFQKTLFELSHQRSIVNMNDTGSQTTGSPSEPLDIFEQAWNNVETEFAQTKGHDPSHAGGIIHNFQHDLESVWWLVLHMITCRAGGDSAKTYGQNIFCNSIQPTPERFKALMTSIYLDLLHCLREPLVTHFPLPMEAIRYAIVEYYLDRQKKTKTLDPSSYVLMLRSFRKFFKAIESTQHKWGSTPISGSNPDVDPGQRKRPRPNDDDPDCGELETARRLKPSRSALFKT